MSYKAGHYYRTRDGRRVHLLAENLKALEYNHTLVGLIEQGNTWGIRTWASNGYYSTSTVNPPTSDIDIVSEWESV